MTAKSNNIGSESVEPETRMILAHQRESFEKLLKVARASFAVDRNRLLLKPRCATLITGPSGSGKSFLAREVAKELSVPILELSASEWILLGCSQRGATHTWFLILKFLLRNNHENGIIFIDEIDKIGHENSPYLSFLRVECFKLLDQKIPEGLTDENDCQVDDAKRIKAEAVLQNTLIFAAGAFQSTLWDKSPRNGMGFGADLSKPPEIDPTNLTDLPIELVNRFRSDLVILPQLVESDYFQMLAHAEKAVAKHLRQTFMRLGVKGIPKALRCRQGCRFIEELLLDAIIEEREMLNLTPTPVAPSTLTKNFEIQIE